MYFEEKRPWQIQPEPVNEAEIVSTDTADIVIIGAGHSGVLAFRAAVEEGADVILLEKSKREFLNVIGHEVGTFNSKYAQSLGVPEYDPIDIIREYQKRSINRCNTGLIRSYAYHSGETFDWFIDALDPKYKERSIHLFMNPSPKYYEGEVNDYRNFIGTMIFNKQDKSLGLAQAVKDTIALTEEKGGRTAFGMSGYYLEKDGERVTGVIAKDTEGKFHRFNAKKGVLLAAGDFSADKQMVTDLLDEFCEISQNLAKYNIPRISGRDGSGIKMGIWAGGHIQPAPRGGMYTTVTGRAGYMGGAAFLKLNAYGKRFTNEGIMGFWAVGLQCARQPEGEIVSIWDANWREDLEYQAIDHLGVDVSDTEFMNRLDEIMRDAPSFGAEGYESIPGMPGAVNNSNKQRRMPGSWNYTVYAADTIEQLAEYLGYTGEYKQNFVNSVNRYNELCAKGRDEDFAKDARLMRPIVKPPFYATPTPKDAGMLMVTAAGLVVDENQQVLNDDMLPIPGLFATGNCAGEQFPIQYSTPIGGSSIGMCQALGRAAGLYMAKL